MRGTANTRWTCEQLPARLEHAVPPKTDRATAPVRSIDAGPPQLLGDRFAGLLTEQRERCCAQASRRSPGSRHAPSARASPAVISASSYAGSGHTAPGRHHDRQPLRVALVDVAQQPAVERRESPPGHQVVAPSTPTTARPPGASSRASKPRAPPSARSRTTPPAASTPDDRIDDQPGRRCPARTRDSRTRCACPSAKGSATANGPVARTRGSGADQR